MIKFGVIKEGKTPSAISGNPADKVDLNTQEAVCKKEKLYSQNKLASSLDTLNKSESKSIEENK